MKNNKAIIIGALAVAALGAASLFSFASASRGQFANNGGRFAQMENFMEGNGYGNGPQAQRSAVAPRAGRGYGQGQGQGRGYGHGPQGLGCPMLD